MTMGNIKGKASHDPGPLSNIRRKVTGKTGHDRSITQIKSRRTPLTKLLKFIANAFFRLPLKTLFDELNNGSDGSEYQFCPFKPSGWPPPPIPLPLGWWW